MTTKGLERSPVLATLGILAIGLSAVEVAAQAPNLVRTDAPVVALTHVAVIDGTGAEAVEDQTVLIRDGDIEAVGAFGSVPVPAGAEVFDLSGHTVMPGIVGLHDHMYLSSNMGSMRPQLATSAGWGGRVSGHDRLSSDEDRLAVDALEMESGRHQRSHDQIHFLSEQVQEGGHLPHGLPVVGRVQEAVQLAGRGAESPDQPPFAHAAALQRFQGFHSQIVEEGLIQDGRIPVVLPNGIQMDRVLRTRLEPERKRLEPGLLVRKDLLDAVLGPFPQDNELRIRKGELPSLALELERLLPVVGSYAEDLQRKPSCWRSEIRRRSRFEAFPIIGMPFSRFHFTTSAPSLKTWT